MSDFLVKDYQTNKKKLDEMFHVDENFDLINREFEMGGVKACIYFVDGLCRDEILNRLMNFFMGLKPDSIPATPQEMIEKLIPYGETSLVNEEEQTVHFILAGVPCMLVDNYDQLIAVDFRTYPARGVEEPDKDKVMRGSKDGFVETLVFNTALIRRRIRSPELTMEIMSGGTSSKTDIAICYMRDRVNHEFLNEIKNKIQKLSIDALTMNQESLAECLYERKWFNPFPKFRYSERPDAAAASVLEGSIVILVDNSPAAMILPTTIFDVIESADDYYFPPVTGTYLRLSRFLINIVTLLLTPTWLLLMNNPQWIPEWLSFITVKEQVYVPLLLQLLILEFAVDGLRMASLNTPSMLSTPLSVIAGIVVGDYTVSSGWFNAESMLYMAFVTIANYSQTSFELGYALKFMRLILLILTGLFGIWGYVGGLIFVVLAIVLNKTIAGKSYIFPLLPLNWKQLRQRLFRVSLPASENYDRMGNRKNKSGKQ
ncbi:spore germination protein [Anaerolentibacter hominis]|uniref:spore germination protein n=1 Tax=Anaerolentibacter hominis TaxID=3079009 RepID=UPI0031B84F35